MSMPGKSVTANDTEALAEASVTLVAVMVCNPGWVPGVNKPVVLMVPVVLLPPVLPSTCHVTPALFGSLKTVAVNCWVWEAVIEPRFGLTATASEPCTTVIVAVLDLEVSATEVAVRVTVAGFGMATGPVKLTVVAVACESAPQVLTLQPTPESDQVTPLL